MASKSEQGHMPNLANFEKLIVVCTSFGTAYNPSKATLKIPALQTQLNAVKTSFNNINTLTPIWKNAVANRITAFKPIDKLITRVSNALKASDLSEETYLASLTLIRKLQGRRATAKLTEEEKKTATQKGEEMKEISSSQMSYDNRLDNLDKLIKFLASIPAYIPNEADLKITSLTTLLNDLKTKNTAVMTSETPLNNARIARNDLLYKSKIGVVDIANDIKTYIKSVFGTTSPQYKSISGLKFTNYGG